MHDGDLHGPDVSGCKCWLKSTIEYDQRLAPWKGVPFKKGVDLEGDFVHKIVVVCKPAKKKIKKDKNWPPNIDADEYDLYTKFSDVPGLTAPGGEQMVTLTRYKQCGPCNMKPKDCIDWTTSEDKTKPQGKPICEKEAFMQGPSTPDNPMGNIWSLREFMKHPKSPNPEQELAIVASVISLADDTHEMNAGECDGSKLPCAKTLRYKDMCKLEEGLPKER